MKEQLAQINLPTVHVLQSVKLSSWFKFPCWICSTNLKS